MSNFNKPDLNAPRFRAKTKKILNKDLYESFIDKYPKYSNLSLLEFREIVVKYNGFLWDGVINHRDGIALPESLGYVVIAKCDRPKGKNTDWVSSIKHGRAVNFSNWDSDNYLAKICYSNYSIRYRLKDRELWSFTPTRSFKTAVAKSFAEMYNKYIHLTHNITLAKLYKK